MPTLQPKKTRQPKPRRGGLSVHASTVALATARALTSHARKHYRNRYLGRYRFAGLVFAFDAVLLVIALGLLVLDVTMFTGFPFGQTAGVDLSFSAADLVSATVLPVEATVHSSDGSAHDDVRLTWQLPPWVEIVRADPPLTPQHSVYLGRVAPLQDKISRLYVRIRTIPGTSVPFVFRVDQGAALFGISSVGTETRTVVQSALTVHPAIDARAVVAGGSVPLVISNQSSLTAPAVILHLTSAEGAPNSHLSDGQEIRLGDLAPGERRVVFLDVDPVAQGHVTFTWELQDTSRAVFTDTQSVDLADPVDVTITAPLRSTPGAGSTDVSYRSAQAAKLLVIHPLQELIGETAVRSYDLAAGTGIVHIPLRQGAHSADTIWSVIPYVERNGGIVLGVRSTGSLSTSFSFNAAARYYATTGDQLGVGPLPPRVGQETTYWIVFTVGPTDADIKNVELNATLGPEVTATGKFASATPGSFTSNGTAVSWTVPSLPATGDTPATFAFEISLTPSSKDRGKVLPLVSRSSATATEVRSGLSLTATDGSSDTNLNSDLQARGKGKVE